METYEYSGKVLKSAQVYTNDPQARVLDVSIEGIVQPVISVTPTSIFLEGQKGRTTTETVLIRGGDRPLRLEQVSFDLQDKINYTVEAVRPGKEYRLHFSNAPDLSGIVTGTLVLRTGYPKKPQVSIHIRGKFRN